MSNHITVTVPADDKKALTAGATMLLTLADKLPPMELDDVDQDPAPPAPSTATEQQEQAASPAPPAGGPLTWTVPTVSDDKPPEPPTTTEATTTGPELDVDGFPHDPRIHAGTKAKTSAGKWKRKRGVDDATREQVEAELRQLTAIPAPASEQQEQATPPAPPAPPTSESAATTTPPPPPAATDEQPMNFAGFLKGVSGLVSSGAITMDRVTEVINGKGIANMQLVGSRPDLIPELWADIQAAAGQA